MTHELVGQLKLIMPKEVKSEKFTKRDIVLMTKLDTAYPQPILIQLNQKLIDIIEQFQIGTNIKVSTNINGKEWFNPTKNITQYFNTIEAWKIEAVGGQQQPTATFENGKVVTSEPAQTSEQIAESLPF